METIQEILDFIWAVVTNYAGLATGGLIVAFVGLYYGWREKTMPRYVVLSLAALFLLLAFFKAWKDQKCIADNFRSESNRPYFSIKEPGIKKLPNSPPFRMMITMENTGVHPATDLDGMLIMVDQSFETSPMISRFSLGNEVPPQSPTPWYTDTLQMAPNVTPMYIVYGIQYHDRRAGNILYSQVWYMKWSGVKDGKTEPDFVYASINEKDSIKLHLKESLNRFTENNY